MCESEDGTRPEGLLWYGRRYGIPLKVLKRGYIGQNLSGDIFLTFNIIQQSECPIYYGLKLQQKMLFLYMFSRISVVKKYIFCQHHDSRARTYKFQHAKKLSMFVGVLLQKAMKLARTRQFHAAYERIIFWPDLQHWCYEKSWEGTAKITQSIQYTWFILKLFFELCTPEIV